MLISLLIVLIKSNAVFVTMVTPEGARAAIQALNGKAMAEYTLIVCEAGPLKSVLAGVRERRDPSRRPVGLAKLSLKGAL